MGAGNSSSAWGSAADAIPITTVAMIVKPMATYEPSRAPVWVRGQTDGCADAECASRWRVMNKSRGLTARA